MYLFGIPMPPSSNSIYRNAVIKGRQRRVKSSGFKSWLKEVDAWALRHPSQIMRLRTLVGELKRTEGLKVDATFWFNRSSVFTAKGTSKRVDVSNRVKCLHDKLAEILGVDDSLFWEISERKRPTSIQGTIAEYVDVAVTAIDLPR